MAITKAKSAGKFKALPAPKSAKPMPMPKKKKMPVPTPKKKAAPKYDDRTGGMTGAPAPKFKTGMPTGKGMSMLKKAFGKK